MLGSTALQMGKLSQMVAVGRVWGDEGSCQLCARFYDFFFTIKSEKEERAFRAQTQPRKALCSPQASVWSRWQRFRNFIRCNFILESLPHLIGEETGDTDRCWEEYLLSVCYVLARLTNSLSLIIATTLCDRWLCFHFTD